MKLKMRYVVLLILILCTNPLFAQNSRVNPDSLNSQKEKLPLLFLKSSINYNTGQLQVGYFDLSVLGYSPIISGKYLQKQNSNESLYLRYLFRNSRKNLSFWNDLLKYAKLTGAFVLAAGHIYKYGFLHNPANSGR